MIVKILNEAGGGIIIINFTITPLNLKDVHLIPSLIKYSMKEELFQLTIYSSHRYEDYLKNILRLPKKLRNYHYFGAYQDKELLGFTEWRIYEEGIFLNHISLFPPYRSSGIGKALLEHGFYLAKLYKKNKISLDVFEDNKFADKWYQKNGFTAISSNHWYVGENKHSLIDGDSLKVSVENFHTAEAEHAQYDFSNMQIKTSKCTYQVGRIKDLLFRLTGLQTMEDEELRYGLQELDDTRLLLVLSEIEIQDNHFLCKGLTKRLSLVIE